MTQQGSVGAVTASVQAAWGNGQGWAGLGWETPPLGAGAGIGNPASGSVKPLKPSR